MLRSTTPALLACAALLLATAGCSLEKVDRGAGPPAPTDAVAAPVAAGQELHRMFEAEKRSALEGELPAQF